MSKNFSQNGTLHFKIDKSMQRSELSALLKDMLTQLTNKLNSLIPSDKHEGSTLDMLVIAREDVHELERIDKFLRLMRHRMKNLEDSEMERLIEFAMPLIDLQQPAEVLDQARRNAELRTNFLKSHATLAAEGVHDLCGSTASNKAALAGDWRNKGKIFSVEHKNRHLYPVFQFNTLGKPKPVIVRILKALGTNMGPWQTAIWFTSPNPILQRRRPIELLDKDPEKVVNAAKQLLAKNLF